MMKGGGGIGNIVAGLSGGKGGDGIGNIVAGLSGGSQNMLNGVSKLSGGNTESSATSDHKPETDLIHISNLFAALNKKLIQLIDVDENVLQYKEEIKSMMRTGFQMTIDRINPEESIESLSWLDSLKDSIQAKLKEQRKLEEEKRNVEYKYVLNFLNEQLIQQNAEENAAKFKEIVLLLLENSFSVDELLKNIKVVVGLSEYENNNDKTAMKKIIEKKIKVLGLNKKQIDEINKLLGIDAKLTKTEGSKSEKQSEEVKSLGGKRKPKQTKRNKMHKKWTKWTRVKK